MNALTLDQPVPTLAGLGVVSIVTLDEPADPEWIGAPLVLASSERWPEHDGERVGALPGDRHTCAGTVFRHGEDCILTPSFPATGHVRLPLGAVVASCRLAACVPIGGPYDFSTGIVEGEAPPTAGMDVLVHHPDLGHGESLMLDRWHGGVEDVTDQLPYGDFTPGRFAWLLEDVKPTTERCPACLGRHNVGCLAPDSDHRRCPLPAGGRWVCLRCAGSGRCDPIAAKGHQRVWRWEP